MRIKENEIFTRGFLKTSKRKLYLVKKTLNEHTVNLQREPTVNKDKLQKDVETMTTGMFNEILPDVIEAIKGLEKNLNHFREECDGKILAVEKKLSPYGNVKNPRSSSNNEEVKSLHYQGKTTRRDC